MSIGFQAMRDGFPFLFWYISIKLPNPRGDFLTKQLDSPPGALEQRQGKSVPFFRG